MGGGGVGGWDEQQNIGLCMEDPSIQRRPERVKRKGDIRPPNTLSNSFII